MALLCTLHKREPGIYWVLKNLIFPRCKDRTVVAATLAEGKCLVVPCKYFGSSLSPFFPHLLKSFPRGRSRIGSVNLVSYGINKEAITEINVQACAVEVYSDLNISS